MIKINLKQVTAQYLGLTRAQPRLRLHVLAMFNACCSVLTVMLGSSIMSATEPPISISSLDDISVLLVPYSHPDFGAALRPGRAIEFNRILPYTVVIKNGSAREIIAYAILWNCLGRDGKTVTQTRSVFNFSKLAPGANLPPGASALVSISPVIEGGYRWDGATESLVDRLLDFYSRQNAIGISLDAILFDDGSSSGRNESHWIEKWQAWLEAEKDVFTEATEASPAALNDVLQRLAEPAFNIHRVQSGTDPKDSAVLGVMADRSMSYDECLALAKGYFAFSILTEINEKGEEFVMTNIRHVLQSKQYPNVHKREPIQ